MSNFGAKVVDFLVKTVLVLSVLSTIFFTLASAFEDLIPQIAAFIGLDPTTLPPLAILTGAGAVLSSISLKVSSTARNITNAQVLWEKEQIKLQKTYFDNGINNVRIEVESRNAQYKKELELKERELHLKEEELKVKSKQLDVEKARYKKITSKKYIK